MNVEICCSTLKINVVVNHVVELMKIRKLEKMCSVIHSMRVRAANVGVNLDITQSADALAQIGARQHLVQSPAMFLSSATRLVQSLS